MQFFGKRRIAFSIKDWDPTDEEWSKLLTLIQPEEVERIGRFKRPLKSGNLVGKNNPDAKTAMIGRLLMRYLICEELEIPSKEIKLKRIKENKPYLENNSLHKFSNFNFNVSHQANYIVLASESKGLVGVDVMEMVLKPNETTEEFFDIMESCFTSFEWENIKKPNSDKEKINQFFRHWTLKESYIKAVSIGLGFELQRAEFTMNEEKTLATVCIDGVEKKNWIFYLDYMENYVIATSIGHPLDSIKNFQNILPDKNVEWSSKDILELERINFEFMDSVDHLIQRS